MVREKKDRNDALVAMYIAGHSCPEIALQFNLSRERVRQLLARKGVRRRRVGRYPGGLRALRENGKP